MERERDLAQAARAELAAIEPSRDCCRRAERAGLGAAARGRARTAAVARLAVRLEAPADAPFDWERAAEHCRVAWLRGLVLGHGSLSLTPLRAHLEIVVTPAEGPETASRLADVGLPAPMRLRRGQVVITWKSRAAIVELLRRTGATGSALDIEALAVNRSLGGQLNRAYNAETANLHRRVASGTRQTEAIEALGAARIARLAPLDRDVARTRRARPDLSLSEIAAGLGVSRGSVQRSLDRIERLAHHDDR